LCGLLRARNRRRRGNGGRRRWCGGWRRWLNGGRNERRHPADDLPGVFGFEPGVRDAGDARFDLAAGNGAGELDGVLGDADFAGDADGFFEEFVGEDAGHRGRERVGDAVFVDGMRTEAGPAEEVFVPESHVVGEVGGLQILPVGFFHLPDLFLTG